MKYQEAQHLFYELLDEWKAYHDAARDMRAKVTQAFSGVAKGGHSQSKSRRVRETLQNPVKSMAGVSKRWHPLSP